MNRIARTLALSLVLAASPTSFADVGDLIGNVNLPVSGVGVSVAVDCDGNVYYTLSGDNNLYKMDAAGNLLATVDTGFDFDELVYDVARDAFWAQLHGSTPVAIYLVQPDGTATFQWNSATISIGTFRDGIALDAGDLNDLNDDQILISGDVSDTIDFYMADGTFVRTLTPTNAAGGTLGLISGVTVGLGDLLYLGRNGAVEIVRVKKSDGTFIGSFASPGGARDEGLECDPINFAPKLALWSREFNSPGFCSVIELEKGTCGCGISEPTAPLCDGPVGPIMATVGVPVVLNFTGTDLDGDLMTLSAPQLPAGAVISPAVGSTAFTPFNVTVTWTPTNAQVGVNTIEVCFSDPLFTTCCSIEVDVAECFLLLGKRNGRMDFAQGGYEFTAQVGGLLHWQAVTMENNPLIPLEPLLAQAYTDAAGRRHVFAQVLMYNPLIFPSNPEQFSAPLHLIFSPTNKLISSNAYGVADGPMEMGARVVMDPSTGALALFMPFDLDGF